MCFLATQYSPTLDIDVLTLHSMSLITLNCNHHARLSAGLSIHALYELVHFTYVHSLCFHFVSATIAPSSVLNNVSPIRLASSSLDSLPDQHDLDAGETYQVSYGSLGLRSDHIGDAYATLKGDDVTTRLVSDESDVAYVGTAKENASFQKEAELKAVKTDLTLDQGQRGSRSFCSLICIPANAGFIFLSQCEQNYSLGNQLHCQTALSRLHISPYLPVLHLLQVVHISYRAH